MRKDFLEKYKVVRRLLLLWACWLITWTTLTVFDSLIFITPSVASALATIVGLMSVVLGFYIKKRFDEDK